MGVQERVQWQDKRKAHRARFQAERRSAFQENSISSPVTNEVTIRIVLVIIIVLQLLAGVLDVKGAFLHGEFDSDEEQIHMTVPDGLEEYYEKCVTKAPCPNLWFKKRVHGVLQETKAVHE